MSSIEKERPRGANHGGKDSKSQAELRSQVLKATTQTTTCAATTTTHALSCGRRLLTKYLRKFTKVHWGRKALVKIFLSLFC